MRIRIWNAYASNNSGSYTIVGLLPSAQVAREVADELTAMIEAHTAWLAAVDSHAEMSESPLAEFCRAHGLTWSSGLGGFDDWPEHSDDNRPRVLAVGSQVVVHHEYTVSLPPTFGEFFYKRGGRVSHEENHAHHPIVTIAIFSWGWSGKERARMEVELPALVARLTAPEGILATTAPPWWPAAWHFGEGSFTVGAVFDDLLDGVSALQAAAEQHRAQMYVCLHEAPDDEHDPLAHLRPSTPPVPRFDVVVTGAGDNRPAVVGALFGALGIYEREGREGLSTLPYTVARALSASRAESAAASLRSAGATVDLVRNDG